MTVHGLLDQGAVGTLVAAEENNDIVFWFWFAINIFVMHGSGGDILNHNPTHFLFLIFPINSKRWH